MFYLKSNKKNYSLLTGSLLLFIGLVIFNNPFGTLEFLLTLVAIGILLWGVSNIIKYKLLSTIKTNQEFILFQGILNILFAVIILISLNFATKTLMFIFGLYLIILSISKISHSLKLKKYSIINWEISLLIGFIELLFGLILFIVPEIISIVFSLLLIILGLIKIIDSFKTR